MNKIVIVDTNCLISLSNSDSLNLLKSTYSEVYINDKIRIVNAGFRISNDLLNKLIEFYKK
jgi:predicted nucleic acid-binding protein